MTLVSGETNASGEGMDEQRGRLINNAVDPSTVYGEFRLGEWLVRPGNRG